MIAITRKPQRFRAFAMNQYMENRDEYFYAGQQQPYSFEEYVAKNISTLKAKYRLTIRSGDSIVEV